MSKLLRATAVAIIAALAALAIYAALSGCDRHRARAAIAALVYGDAEGAQVSAFAVSEHSGTTVSELVEAMAAGYDIAPQQSHPREREMYSLGVCYFILLNSKIKTLAMLQFSRYC